MHKLEGLKMNRGELVQEKIIMACLGSVCVLLHIMKGIFQEFIQIFQAQDDLQSYNCFKSLVADRTTDVERQDPIPRTGGIL